MGRIPKPALAVLHQRLQHLHQVGRDLGAACTTSRSFTLDVPGTRPRGRPDVARAIRTSSATARYVAAQLRELIARLRAASRGTTFDIDRLRESAGARQRDEPRLAARPRAQPEPPAAVQRADRRHRSTSAWPTACAARAEGARYFERPGRGDGVQGARTASARSPTSSTGCSSSACPAIRSSAASTRCSPSGAACSSTRPTCGSPRAARTSASQYDLARPIESLAEGAAHRRAPRDGQHVLPGPRARRDDRRLRASTASSSTRSRAAGRCPPGSPTAGAR